MLRIGQIEYANCTPVFHLLKNHFPCSDYEFVTGVPTYLNGLLKRGDIDICPSSSIEYALYSDLYRIVPELSISSDGAVASVLLFSRVPVDRLDSATILLSSESATSVNLLKVLMVQRYNCRCRYAVTTLPFSEALTDAPGLLLIGDAALRASFENSDMYVYDLGTLWRDWTGLPFVFALWLCRNDVADTLALKKLAGTLIKVRDLLPAHYAEAAGVAPEADWLGHDRLLAYWRDNICYDLDENKKLGLKLFYQKCCETELIHSVPELKFSDSYQNGGVS